ncbi:hypothetical protein acsn021_10900 [Anaerocolumna cellulosilytica]|uniref:Uncharacterized protein n=1 Tax=Anaerocolumna cellulosilytica TaxID=433286 RepID=A0A6S6R2Y1_9FIRM|nr:hypothetical protein [Anaerocolumna cellulosilytica]MBB5194577.1 hypothetical protein [Anaerocolumna cellulosilytica]BCJ93521.1 hypothetical protein acsn021_10900 [Anaerocolumna cellulosilytica]
MKHEIDIEKELERSFQQWENLYIYGGSDPFHSDGVNLSLGGNCLMTKILKSGYYETFI